VRFISRGLPFAFASPAIGASMQEQELAPQAGLVRHDREGSDPMAVANQIARSGLAANKRCLMARRRASSMLISP
jgi:hypothetical protein